MIAAGAAATTARPVVLHVAPHPDDELLGAGGTLVRLQRLGWEVVNLACGLGRPDQHERRRGELEAATRTAGFILEVASPPTAMASDDDLVLAEERLVGVIGGAIARLRPSIVIGPHEQDLHHAHEMVGRATRRAVEVSARPPVWWAWGLWCDLRSPNLYSPFAQTDLDRVASALDAYEGENQRNDYRRLLAAKAVTANVLGNERVFGFGSAAATHEPYADLLAESSFGPTGWRRERPRLLEPDQVLPPGAA